LPSRTISSGAKFANEFIFVGRVRDGDRRETSGLGILHLMLAFPFPYIANTLGWMTAELGRQPCLVYGLFRTQEGYSKVVSSGDTIFTLIGFTGLYLFWACFFSTWWDARSVTDRTKKSRLTKERHPHCD
jgi:cytochrome bd-type quinol oxidase subunit 1